MTSLLPSALRSFVGQPALRALFVLLGGLAMLIGTAGCDASDPAVEPRTDELDAAAFIANAPDLETLAAAVDAAGLGDALAVEGPVTVFAPQNAAFDPINVDALTGDADLLDRVLTFHVVEGAIAREDIEDGATVTTLQGTELTFSVDEESGDIEVNGVPLSGRSVTTTNGHLHRLGGVMLDDIVNMAERAQITAETSALSSVLPDDLAADLADESASFIVFAPIDAAVGEIDAEALTGDADLLDRVLGFHVVEGSILRAADITDGQTVTTREGTNLTFSVDDEGGVWVNGAGVVTADVETTNGVIHLIDGVLLDVTTVGERVALMEQYNTLEQALVDTGRDALLDGEGAESPFTLFAPTNAAFEDVDLDALTPTELGDVLDYHLLTGGAVASGDISDGQTATTREGSDLTFGVEEGGTVTINDSATVTEADLESTNGVVHTIDAVLLPPDN